MMPAWAFHLDSSPKKGRGLALRGGSLRILVLAAALLLTASAVAQPFPSFLLDTSRVYGPDAEDASKTAVASGDSVILVVWSRPHRIRGCRLTRDFRLLDSACIDISGVHPRSVDNKVDVAWGGEDFLVVWLATDFDTAAVMAGLVSQDGLVARRLVVDGAGQRYEEPTVAFDGVNFVVVWREDRCAKYVRVTPWGEVLGPAMPVSPAGGWQQNLAIAATEGRSLVAFADPRQPGGNGVYANMVFSDGTLRDSAPFCVSLGVPDEGPVAAHDGSHFVVGWSVRQDSEELRLARVDSSGVVLDSGGVAVDTMPSIRKLGLGAWQDTSLFVYVSNQDSFYQVKGRRVDGALRRLDSTRLDVSALYVGNDHWWPTGLAVSRVGPDFLVSWSHLLVRCPAVGRDAVARRISRTGELVDSVEVPVSLAAGYQLLPDVASDGENFLAVWSDIDRGRGPFPRLRMTRFSREGVVLDTSMALCAGVGFLGVAYGGGCYLVFWARPVEGDSEAVEVLRVGRDGVPLDSQPRELSHGFSEVWTVDAAFGDGLFLVVWNRRSDVFGMRITPDGSVLDSAPVRLEVGQTWSASPHVASDGQKFLVTRYDHFGRQIRAVRVSSACELLDTAEILIKQVRNMGTNRRAQVAYGAGVYLVTDHYGEQGWRVSPDGEVLDTAIKIPWELSQSQLPVAFDGTNFQLVAGTGRLVPEYEMGGVRVSPEGQVLDPQPLPLVVVDPIRRRLGHESWAITADSSGSLGMVFCIEELYPYMTSRLRGCIFPRIVGGAAEPGDGADARSGSPTFVKGSLSVGTEGPHGGDCAYLFDAMGRLVLALQSGPNDIRHVAPGVYFVRCGARGSPRRAIITR